MVRWFGQWFKTRGTQQATNIKVKKHGEIDRKTNEVISRVSNDADDRKVTKPSAVINKGVTGEVGQSFQLIEEIVEGEGK